MRNRIRFPSSIFDSQEVYSGSSGCIRLRATVLGTLQRESVSRRRQQDFSEAIGVAADDSSELGKARWLPLEAGVGVPPPPLASMNNNNWRRASVPDNRASSTIGFERSTMPVDERSRNKSFVLDSNARQRLWTSVQAISRSSSPFGLERSTMPVDERSSNQPFVLVFGFERSTLNLDERSNKRPCVLALWTRTLDNAFGRAFNRSATVRPCPLDSNARQCLWTSVQAISRSSSSLDSNARHIMWTSVQIKDRASSTLGFERSTIPVDERSSNQPFVLVFGFERSTLNVDERSNKRPSSTIGFERSTIHADERSTFGRLASKMFDLCFQPLDNLCTSIQAVGRSASKMFDLCFQPLDNLYLTDARLGAFVASLNIDAKQSAVRPHPSDSKRPTLTLPDVRPTRLNGPAFRGPQRPSFLPIAVRHFPSRPYFNTNAPTLGLTLVRPPDVRHLGFNRSANRLLTFGNSRRKRSVIRTHWRSDTRLTRNEAFTWFPEYGSYNREDENLAFILGATRAVIHRDFRPISPTPQGLTSKNIDTTRNDALYSTRAEVIGRDIHLLAQKKAERSQTKAERSQHQGRTLTTLRTNAHNTKDERSLHQGRTLTTPRTNAHYKDERPLQGRTLTTRTNAHYTKDERSLQGRTLTTPRTNAHYAKDERSLHQGRTLTTSRTNAHYTKDERSLHQGRTNPDVRLELNVHH
ncbi:hypothetical protein LR48_Vigan741s000800 [Vigna angularis]|uniref:Uncharacterized protein n=1 Tax=Phaseolus angularis TaxID=3914 RepID=A0A0L9TGP4_PHAAN|nr:hypothetical protein LR48_Vigan741s000800 [Vigna angularis]